MKDVEKLIESAKNCAEYRLCMNNGAPCYALKGYGCEVCKVVSAIEIISHYEALLKAERSKWIEEVREHVNRTHVPMTSNNETVYCVTAFSILTKLNSMGKEEPHEGGN